MASEAACAASAGRLGVMQRMLVALCAPCCGCNQHNSWPEVHRSTHMYMVP